MGSWWRNVLGAGFSGLGIAAWVLTWSWLGPPPVGDPPIGGGVPGWLNEQTASVSARWTAVAIGVGGLVLGVRAWRRGLVLTVALGVAWLAADAVLDLSDVDPSVGVAVTAAAVGSGALALLAAGWRRGTAVAPAWALLAYAGVLVTLVATPRTVLNMNDRDNAWLLPALAGTGAVLAAVLALAASPWPPPRWRVWGLVGAVIALVGFAFAAAKTDGGPTLLVYALLLGAPVLLATLVALAVGLPPRGRGVAAYGGLVLAALAVGASLVLASLWPEWFRLESLGLPAAWIVAASTIGSGLLVGASLVVGAGTVRRMAPRPAVGDAPPTPRPAGVSVSGGLLILAGTAGWVVLATDLQPRIAAIVTGWRGEGFLRHGLSGTNSFEGLGWDLRFAAIVLAASGLRLLAWGRPRRRAVLGGVGAWLGLDVLLLATTVVPPAAADWVVVAVAAAVVAGAVLLASRRDSRTPPEPGRSFVYSGILLGVGVLLLDDLTGWMADELPLVVPLLLTALLAGAAVITAAVGASPSGSPGQAWPAAGLGAVAAGAVVGVSLWRLFGDATVPVRMLVGGLVLAGLVLACGLLAGVVPRSGWRLPAVAGVVAFGAPGVLIGAMATAILAVLGGRALLGAVLEVTGPFDWDETARPLTVQGALCGASFAVLALLPRALSTLDPVAAPPPDSPPDTEPAARSAPLAVPGVPEILEWPPRPALAPRR